MKLENGASDYWEAYSQRLKKTIVDEGLLLNANNFSTLKSGQAYFKHASQLYSREFITMWELFDKGEVFNEFIENLIKKAKEIQSVSYFSKIVTTTDTALELSKFVVPQLENQVIAQHFGDYPASSSVSINRSGYHRDKSLIITDVIASGSLMKRLSKSIQSTGDEVIGILCFAVTRKEIARERRIKIKYYGTEYDIPVFYLTHYGIDYRSQKPVHTGSDQVEFIEIDPKTVLPKPKRQYLGSYNHKPPREIEASFDMQDTFEHFQLSDAIKSGFFEFNNHKFTTAFKIDAVLEEYGDEIWNEVNQKIRSCQTIITTYRKEDLDFKKFITERLRKSDIPVYTVKRSIKDSPFFHYSLSSESGDIGSEKPVLLLLSSVSSTEKMRSIVSLLATFGVKDITILCLINRMGPYTASFITAIQELSFGSRSQVKLRFIPIYNFRDYSGQEIDNVNQGLRNLLARYSRFTYVYNFKQLVRKVTSDLEPKSSIHNELDLGGLYDQVINGVLLDTANPMREFSIDLANENHLLSFLSYKTSITRDYQELIEKFDFIKTEDGLYYVTRLILIDIELLRFSGKIYDIEKAFRKRIHELRLQRIKSERQIFNKDYGEMSFKELEDEIDYAFNLEKCLMFCYALLINFYDESPRSGDRENIQFLFYLIRKEDWLQSPYNFKLTFSDDFYLFCISLWLFGTHERFKVKDTAVEFKQILKKTIEDFSNLSHLKLLESEYKKEFKNKNYLFDGDYIKSNLDTLLKEIGVYDIRRKVEVVDYLLGKVMLHSRQHNGVYNTIYSLVLVLGKKKEGESFKEVLRTKRAITATRHLFGICEWIRMFFTIMPSSVEADQFYIADKNDPGLLNEVKTLEKCLGQLANDSKVSKRVVNEIMNLFDTIFEEHFFNPSSHLRNCLSKYLAKVETSLLKVIETVTHELKEKTLGGSEAFRITMINDLAGVKEKLEAQKKIHMVLVDHYLLEEVFKNLFKNLRHTEKERQQSQLSETLIQLDDICEDESWVKLVFRVFDIIDETVIENSSNTYFKLNKSLNDFDAKISIKSSSKNSSVEIKLLNKREFQASENEDKRHIRNGLG